MTKLFIQFLLLAFSTLSTPNLSFAWYYHPAILKTMMGQKDGTRAYLKQKILLPCQKDEQAEIKKLEKTLEINGSKIPLRGDECSKTKSHKTQTVLDLLQSEMIEEPDLGMDQNLPNTADPMNDRTHMGGQTGPSSQGFRHMIFSGIEWTSPLRTFQLPFRSVGQAPQRIVKLKQISEQYFKEGNLFWGIRTLLWALHVIQDLHQPFHVMQVPYYRMLPLKKLFSHFVEHSTRVIANYHYAFEGMALEFLPQCFDNTYRAPALPTDRPTDHPTDIDQLIKNSRKQANDLGKLLFAYLDDQMKDPELNLPLHPDDLDYYVLAHALPESLENKQGEALMQLKQFSCESLRQVIDHTWIEFDLAFRHLQK